MPELPEVEIVRRSLSPVVEGRVLEDVRIDDIRLVAPEAPADIAAELTGRRIEHLERRGKYLAWSLDGEALLATHLRMTGMFRLPEDGLPERTRALMRLDDGRLIAYTDTRRFGTWELLRTREEQGEFFSARLGPEPLDDEFTARWLRTVLRRRTGPLKAVILDQRVCAGMGNIYASEALFRARLHPLRRANSLSRAEAERLVAGIQTALTEGIRFGGSSIRDYTSPDGSSGEAQDEHLVYGREGEPCPSCGRELSRLVIGGRTTVFCSRCQRSGVRRRRVP
jgi:formamidopyrimidine-DNA glycosylase